MDDKRVVVLWDVVSCNLVDIHQHFKRAYFLGFKMMMEGVISCSYTLQHPIRQLSSY
jgi:hypothetical protein